MISFCRNIGAWLQNLLQQAKNGDLSSERIQLIEDALGVDALAPVIDFERTLTEVVHHTFFHRHFPSARADDPHENRLGKWLVTQRMQYKYGTLPAGHTYRLDSTFGSKWRIFTSKAV